MRSPEVAKKLNFKDTSITRTPCKGPKHVCIKAFYCTLKAMASKNWIENHVKIVLQNMQKQKNFFSYTYRKLLAVFIKTTTINPFMDFPCDALQIEAVAYSIQKIMLKCLLLPLQ